MFFCREVFFFTRIFPLPMCVGLKISLKTLQIILLSNRRRNSSPPPGGCYLVYKHMRDAAGKQKSYPVPESCMRVDSTVSAEERKGEAIFSFSLLRTYCRVCTQATLIPEQKFLKLCPVFEFFKQICTLPWKVQEIHQKCGNVAIQTIQITNVLQLIKKDMEPSAEPTIQK